MHLALSPCLLARAAVTSKVGRKALAALAVREAAASDTHTPSASLNVMLYRGVPVFALSA